MVGYLYICWEIHCCPTYQIGQYFITLLTYQMMFFFFYKTFNFLVYNSILMGKQDFSRYIHDITNWVNQQLIIYVQCSSEFALAVNHIIGTSKK